MRNGYPGALLYPNKQPASSRGLAVANTTCTPSLRLARRFAIAQIETLSSFLFAVPMGAYIYFFNRTVVATVTHNAGVLFEFLGKYLTAALRTARFSLNNQLTHRNYIRAKNSNTKQ